MYELLPKPLPVMNKNLDKVVRYLAKGYSNRAIEMVLKVDRGSYRFYFLSEKYLSRNPINARTRATISRTYSDKVCNDVLENKLTYWQIRKKWGSKGLEALHTRWDLLRIERDKDLTEKIVPMREQGLSFDQIAKKLGICGWSANMFYRKHNKQRPNFYVHKKKGLEISSQILLLHKQGLTPTQIAESIKRSPGHVNHVLKRLGISTKAQGLSKEDMLKVYKLRQAGMSWPEIGYIFGKVHVTVASNYRNHRAEVEKWAKEQNLIHK